MAHFRCTACGYGCEHPTAIGAGDCPYCGGDVMFDLRRQAPRPPVVSPSDRAGRQRDEAGGCRGGYAWAAARCKKRISGEAGDRGRVNGAPHRSDDGHGNGKGLRRSLPG